MAEEKNKKYAYWFSGVFYSYAYTLGSGFKIIFDDTAAIKKGDFYYQICHNLVASPRDEGYGKHFLYLLEAFLRNMFQKGKIYMVGDYMELESVQKDSIPYLKITLIFTHKAEVYERVVYLDRAECHVISSTLREVIHANKKSFGLIPRS